MPPTLIGIGGAHSKSGKTSMACALLRALGPGWGAIKCEPKYLYSSVADDPATVHLPGTDTGRMREAGAEEVLWVRASETDPAEPLQMAMDRMGHLRGVIVEGNRAIEVLRPDIVIFMHTSAGPKPSAQGVIPMARVFVGDGPLPDGASRDAVSAPWGLWDEAARIVFEMVMKDKIRELIEARAEGGKLSCAEAWRIAGELGVTKLEVGKAADELKIKIKDCQLGCF